MTHGQRPSCKYGLSQLSLHSLCHLPPDKNSQSNTMMMMILLLALVSRYSTGYVIPPPVLEDAQEDANYFLVPITMLGEGDEGITDLKEDPNVEDIYQPSNEEVLEALLSQLDNPEQSEEIYNNLVNHSLEKKDAETLQHQLDVLKSGSFKSQPDIDYRKHSSQDEGRYLVRKKRSLPPYVEPSSGMRRRMH